MLISNKIEKLINQYILKVVESEFPKIRNHKYSNEYYLSNFRLMLKDLNSWRALQNVKSYPENVKYHYKYLNQVFNSWVSKDVFKKSYELLLKDHYFKLYHISKSNTLKLFIDSTFIINKYGQESIAKNPEYKKKNVTKLYLISDDNSIILGIIPVKINNYKSFTSFPHDVKYIK